MTSVKQLEQIFNPSQINDLRRASQRSGSVKNVVGFLQTFGNPNPKELIPSVCHKNTKRAHFARIPIHKQIPSLCAQAIVIAFEREKLESNHRESR